MNESSTKNAARPATSKDIEDPDMEFEYLQKKVKVRRQASCYTYRNANGYFHTSILVLSDKMTTMPAISLLIEFVESL